MKRVFDTTVKRVPEGRKLKKILLITTLSFYLAVVPLIATMSLQIAMTEEIDPVCGFDEHIHAEECYEAELECGQLTIKDQIEHHHDENCYDSEDSLICELAETHLHAEECYLVSLICEKAEHTHIDECLIVSDLLMPKEKSMKAAAVSSFESGSGTAGDPYIIATAEQLAWLAELVNSQAAEHTGTLGAQKHYKLSNDIDLSAYDQNVVDKRGKGWVPIGDSITIAYAFKGTFDGNGKKITGLYIDRSVLEANLYNNHSALFGYTSGATIKNLGVVEADVSGYRGVAGIIASMADGSTLENCYVTGSIKGQEEVGGLVGTLNLSTPTYNVISKCYSTASVDAIYSGVGGIAGNCRSNAIIANSYSTGDVSNIISIATARAAGILGNAESGSSVEIRNCYATGDIISKSIAGGIVTGNQTGSPKVDNCVALSLEIIGDSSSGRISGGLTSVTFNNNRAYDQIKNSDGDTTWLPAGSLTNQNGKDMTAKEALTADFWTDSMGWDGTSVWHIKDGKLPVLIGLDGQTGAPHFEEYIDWSIATAQINCEKIVAGNGAPDDKEFKFKLTEVDENGMPVEPLFEMEMIISGAGEFKFDVPIYTAGTHYYRIAEEAEVQDGWIYDSGVHIVEVNVTDDIYNTVTTSLDGEQDTYFKVKFGSPTITNTKPDPPLVFDVTPGKQYRYIGTSYLDYRISDGAKTYIGMCASYHYNLPSLWYPLYRQRTEPFGSGANDLHMALAAALSVPATGGFQNGTGLNDAEYAGLFGIGTPENRARRSAMQSLVWYYRDGTGTIDYQSKLRDTIGKMVSASNSTPAGQSITSLSLKYDEVTGRLSFSHEGYQPPEYDTRLTWSGDTVGLTVRVNGHVAPLNVRVQETDVITVEYTGIGTVKFLLTDHQFYLKAGSIKGAVLNNISNSSIQPCLVGSAEFANLQIGMNITRYTSWVTQNSLMFVNEFKTMSPASAEIVGSKAITGMDASNEVFTFNLTQVTDIGGATPTSPLYTDSDSTTGAGAFSFNINGLYPGTYFFRIEEEITDVPDGWTYDGLPHVVRVDVSDDATPVVSITYPYGELVFTNTYKRPGGVSIVIDGEKRIEGGHDTDKSFVFSLVQVSDITGETSFTEGEPHVDSKKTTGAETFSFEIEDLFPGVYYYKITEVEDGSNDGWIYDSTEYIVVVTITEDVSAGYKAEVTYYKNEDEVDEIVFENTYTFPPSADAVIRGTKEITGILNTDKEFKFILQRVTDETGEYLFTPMYDKTAVREGAGDFAFTIQRLLPGVYYYQIAEDASGQDGRWQFDQSLYVVTVTVTEDLEVIVDYPDASGVVSFSNRFHSEEFFPETGGVGKAPFFVVAIGMALLLSVSLFGASIYRRQSRR